MNLLTRDWWSVRWSEPPAGSLRPAVSRSTTPLSAWVALHEPIDASIQIACGPNCQEDHDGRTLDTYKFERWGFLGPPPPPPPCLTPKGLLLIRRSRQGTKSSHPHCLRRQRAHTRTRHPLKRSVGGKGKRRERDGLRSVQIKERYAPLRMRFTRWYQGQERTWPKWQYHQHR